MKANKKADLNLTIGMIVIAIGAIMLGFSVSFVVTKNIVYDDTLSQMKEDGYVITDNCTATAEDIVAGKTAYINGELVTGTREVLDTNGCTATADIILEGKTAYINGKLVTGTLKTYEGTTLTATATGNQIDSNVYMPRNIIIPGEPNLLAENIKAGIKIYGVTGTYGSEGE